MREKQEIEELKKDVHDLHMGIKQLQLQCAMETRALRSVVSANCEKAKGITLEELARYVLDGKPIMRDKVTAAYEPEQPSTSKCASSWEKPNE